MIKNSSHAVAYSVGGALYVAAILAAYISVVASFGFAVRLGWKLADHLFGG